MHYEINVALNGNHLFATHKRSATNCFQAEILFHVFRKKFPKEEGYHVTMMFWEEKGTVMFDSNKPEEQKPQEDTPEKQPPLKYRLR